MGRGLLAGVLIAMLLLSTLMSVSPALHRLIHQDAGNATHQCAVTLLSQHQLVASAPAPVLPRAAAVVSLPVRQTPILLLPIAEFTLPPGRGPPAVLL